MTHSDKLDRYASRLRSAYTIYYDALISYGEPYIETIARDEATKKMLKGLIGLLRRPEDASLGYAITVGLLATYGSYEWSYSLGKQGGHAGERSERALHELQELTYENDDPEIQLLVEVAGSSAAFSGEVERVAATLGKMQQ